MLFNSFPHNFLNKFIPSVFNIQENQSLIQARDIPKVLPTLIGRAGDQLVIIKSSEH